MARRVASELFVSRLSFYITTGELKKLFSPFGLIEEVRLIKDPRTQRPKGFGFVKFAAEEDAQNALKAMNGRQRAWRTRAGIISDSKVPTTFTADSAGEGIDVLPDSGGPGDNFRGSSGDDGGGGGGGDDDGNNDGGSGGNEDPSEGHEKKAGMSMSQKLTLGYAALVGIGGAMGYLKGGSKKSLIAGGVSASVLYIVYTLLPSNPVLASSLGLILSASLLGVMGSRFKKSGKIFPAGIISFMSLIMSGGYLHGILRSLH